jgi:hypothetical protein
MIEERDGVSSMLVRIVFFLNFRMILCIDVHVDVDGSQVVCDPMQ